MHIGRVVGNRVLETTFRTTHDEPLQVGEMLIVEDGRTETRYLIRVMDIEYGADAEEPDWMRREAGAMLSMDSKGQKAEPQDLDRLYRLGVAVPLGYIEATDFRKTKSIPPHFSRVRKAGEEDYHFLRPFLGEIEVGNLRSGDKVMDFPVGISERAIPHHIGIFATTGMGKSNLMKNLALSCMRLRRNGFLILDPHGEYYDGGEMEKKGLKHAGSRESLEVFSSRKLDGPYNTLRIAAREIEIADLQNLYEFTQPQLECLQGAQFRYGESWLMDLRDRDVKQIFDEMGGKYHEGTINVIKRRLDNIFRFGLLTTDPQLSVTGHVIDCLHGGKVVLVDTSNMFEAEELLVSTVLCRAVFERNKALYSDKQRFESLPPVLMALEEAQRVLSEAKGTIFAQIAREGRKFKVGLCAISQQPKLIEEEILSQFNTLFILGLADKRDRGILRDSAKQDVSQLDNEIQMLMPGEALIASPFTPFAVPVKVHLYEERLGKEEAGERDKTSPANSPAKDLRFF